MSSILTLTQLFLNHQKVPAYRTNQTISIIEFNQTFSFNLLLCMTDRIVTRKNLTEHNQYSPATLKNENPSPQAARPTARPKKGHAAARKFSITGPRLCRELAEAAPPARIAGGGSGVEGRIDD